MSFIPLKVGTLCSFSFISFCIGTFRDPPISTENFKSKLWPNEYEEYKSFIILEVLDKDKVYIAGKWRYFPEKHQPYFCYSVEKMENFICLHGELKEIQ